MKKRLQERPSRKKIKVPLHPAVIIGIAAAVAVVWYGWWLMHNAECFRVKYVNTRGGDPAALMHLKGRNIFRVDLEKEASLLLQTYPDYHNVQIVRVLPNRIFVNLIQRRPVALIKLYRMFAIDESGVLFQVRPEYEAMGLSVITGLETRIFGPKPGRRYAVRELSSALEMITLVKSNPQLRGYRLCSVDVSSATQASMTLVPSAQTAGTPAGQAIEVRMGSGHLGRKVSILSGLLMQQSAQDIGRIAYIDLRFKEPVIKLKDGVKKGGVS